MAFTVHIEGADADALQRQADAERRPVEELAREIISRHVVRGVNSGDLDAEIAAVRADDDLTGRIEVLVQRDKGIFDRLERRARIDRAVDDTLGRFGPVLARLAAP